MTTAKADESTPKPTLPRIYNQIVINLENCILPEKLLSETPSRQDGLDRETEIDLRILGCELIQTAGILLKLPQVAMATGQVLFQRFFYTKSFVRHSMETTAMSCICLASKIEEAPRRIRDVMNVFHHIKQVRAQKPITSLIIDINYIALKTQVIKAERRVLKELGFCVHVKHPHKLIVMYLQVLGFEHNQKMMQMAWNFMNDSLRTDVFVRYHPETIACACIHLTARKLAQPLPSSPSWYAVFKFTEADITDVCYRICQLYRRPKPNVDHLEAAVEELKKRYTDSKNKSKAAEAPPAVQHHNDRSNGAAHNAWSGFYSRTIPLEEPNNSSSNNNNNNSSSVNNPNSNNNNGSGNNNQPESRKSSRSRSRSRTPGDDDKGRGRHKSGKTSRDRRDRSRSPRGKKKRYSRSPSSSPHHSKARKSDKKGDRSPDRRSRERHTNGGDRKQHDDREKRSDRDRDGGGARSRRRSSKYDRHGSSSASGRDRQGSGKHRDRSKDRRR